MHQTFPNNSVTALRRPCCRIAWGDPGEDGGGWKTATPLPRLTLWGSFPRRLPDTAVRALAGEREFFIRFDCRVENRAVLRPRQPRVPVAEHEHVFFEIMPRNDPTDRWRIAGTFVE